MATAPAPGFPLPLRNALAHLVLAALDDRDADASLAWLEASAADAPPDDVRDRLHALHVLEADGTLVDVHRPHVERMRLHASRARRAVAAFHARPPAADVGRVAVAVDRGIALWNERLFFEVHEVLEAEWIRATGDERQALQGVIQVGVALHHHAHGNARGARTLMREGRERLAATGHALPTLDVDALLADTAAWEAALVAGATLPEAPPALRRRSR
jgi:predicted metal-dependent hydrolase